MTIRKSMRLKPRNGTPEQSQEIGGAQEEGPLGYRVRDAKGNDLGYFGPDKYESIIFEVHWTD